MHEIAEREDEGAQCYSKDKLKVLHNSKFKILNSKFKIQNSTKTDTVVVTEYRDRVIEHPPEKYVPKFYKWCTGLFWAIGLLAIGYWLLKWWLKCRI